MGRRRWVSGQSGRVVPVDCAISHGAPQVSDPLFFSLHLIAAKSAPAVPNEGRVFHPFSGRLIFRFLGVVVHFFNASSPSSSWGKFSYI